MLCWTVREQNIEQVAYLIQGLLDRDPGAAPDTAAITAQNAAGWSFDVRYDGEEYVSGESWTRIEGCVLAPGDLQAAIALAQSWSA